MVVFAMQGCSVERRGSVAGRDLRFVVIHDRSRQVQQCYATLEDAKKWFFGIGL
jgi:hypothetical protein